MATKGKKRKYGEEPPALQNIIGKFKNPPFKSYKVPNLLVPPKYTVYVVVLRITGQFYVGVTCDPATRERTHFREVTKAVMAGRSDIWQRWMNGDDDPRYSSPEGRRQNAYQVMAKEIIPYVNGYVHPDKAVPNYFYFQTVASAYTLEEARFLEEMVINNAILHCPERVLNINKKSSYIKNIKLYV